MRLRQGRSGREMVLVEGNELPESRQASTHKAVWLAIAYMGHICASKDANSNHIAVCGTV
jgi:hypothetical protein